MDSSGHPVRTEKAQLWHTERFIKLLNKGLMLTRKQSLLHDLHELQKVGRSVHPEDENQTAKTPTLSL